MCLCIVQPFCMLWQVNTTAISVLRLRKLSIEAARNGLHRQSMRVSSLAIGIVACVSRVLAIDVRGSIAVSVLPLSPDSSVLLNGAKSLKAFVARDGSFRL